MLHVKLISIAASAITVATFVSTASAQEQQEGYFRARVYAPQRALELTPGLSYAEPFGDAAKGANVRDFAGSALAPTLGIAYRLTPHVAIGVTGMYQEFSAGNDVTAGTTVRGHARAVGGGPDVTVHFRPYERVDPFLRAGFGYRAMWELRDGANNDVVRHGLELGRLALGLDMRVSRDVAIAPVIGANANVFFWESRDNGASGAIPDPRVNVTAMAGLEARFDLGGDRVYHENGGRLAVDTTPSTPSSTTTTTGTTTTGTTTTTTPSDTKVVTDPAPTAPVVVPE